MLKKYEFTGASNGITFTSELVKMSQHFKKLKGGGDTSNHDADLVKSSIGFQKAEQANNQHICQPSKEKKTNKLNP
jgi:hypothetical protein